MKTIRKFKAEVETDTIEDLQPLYIDKQGMPVIVEQSNSGNTGSARPYKVFTGELYASPYFENIGVERENTIGILTLSRISEREFNIELPNVIDYNTLFISPITGMVADMSGVGVPGGGGFSDAFVPIQYVHYVDMGLGGFIFDGIRIVIPSGYTLPTSYSLQFSLEYRIYQ